MLVWETLSTVSGGQKMTLAILDMLSEQFEFCCLIPKEGMLSNELNMRGIPYVVMGDQSLPTGVKGKKIIFRYAWMSLKNICKSLGAIRKYKPDLLYCPGPAALPWSAVCGVLSRKPVVWHLHHVFLDGATRKLLNRCGKWKAVRRIVAVSNCVGNQIDNKVAHSKIEVLYNPVDEQRYANGDAVNIRGEIEDKLNLSLNESKCILGHVALIQRSKQQDFVLDVLSELKAKGENPIGLFAGEVRENDYYDELRNKAKELHLEKQVAFLGRREDIPDLLNMLSVLVIPSAFEGFPLAGLEAAAAGVPVVACDVAGAEEFVQVSGAGTVFHEGNASEAVLAVENALVHKEEMVGRGRLFAKKMCNSAYKKRICQIMEQIQ